MMELTKERLTALSNRENVGAICSDEIVAMARQLLAGLEQEPVAYMYKDRLHTDARFSLHTRFGNWSQEDINEYEITEIPLYAAPQLPQTSVVVSDEVIDTFEAEFRRAFEVSAGVEQLIEIGYQGEKFSLSIRDAATWWKLGRAAMLQGSEPVHDVDNTNRQFESLGLIVTSDERKMELPRCSKHPETELQVHPFEQLLSYPPQPAMYCPLCRPSVAEWVEFDKQLRQWKEVK